MKKKISAFLASMLLLGSIGGAAMAEGMTPGTYEAAAQGFHGDVKLSVTVDAEKITAIDILEHSETEGIGAAALPKLVEAVLANQTIGVDSVAASEPEDVQMDADVVVVGAGAAGLSAALKTAQNGHSVILLEKMGVIGGASAMAGSGTMATGSKWQKEEGYEDSAEKLVEDMMANGHQKNDRATVELFANTIGEAFDWLVGEDGAAVPYQRSGKTSRSYSGEGRGAGVCKNLAERLEAAGGTLLTNTPATELVVENGAVVGVKAEGEGKAYTIRAKAVILASGG